MKKYTEEYPFKKIELAKEVGRLIRENEVKEIVLYSSRINIHTGIRFLVRRFGMEIHIRNVGGGGKPVATINMISFLSAFISLDGSLVILS